ncbi:MAG: hypothetical protein ACRCX2_09430 [Paraclostridium sp.]
MIFLLTIIYLILSKVDKFDEKKFKDMTVLTLLPTEFTIPLSIIYLIGKVFVSVSGTMLTIISKILIKQNGGEKNVL